MNNDNEGHKHTEMEPWESQMEIERNEFERESCLGRWMILSGKSKRKTTNESWKVKRGVISVTRLFRIVWLFF